MKIRKMISGAAVCAVLGISLCGCGIAGNGSLEQSYSFEEHPLAIQADDAESSRTVPLFAENLCVVDDEGVFDFDFVDSESGAVFSISDGTVIYSKNAFETLYPASITKVMTALLAIKYGNLDDEVTVTEDAVITESGATLCGIKPGDKLSLRQLLYGLMLPSGNDAGAAIAVHMDGTIEAFADRMNREAALLGATGTHFVNPHGLSDSNHYTTAYDLYLIFQEALKYPEFREITGTTAYTADYVDGAGNPVSKTWEGGNWYLTGKRQTPDGLTVFSGKTGTTKAAGYCLIMASKDEKDHEYISVILKAGSRDNLYDNMTNIISQIVK